SFGARRPVLADSDTHTIGQDVRRSMTGWLSKWPIAETLHFDLVLIDHPFDLRLAECGAPLVGLADPEEFLGIVRSLAKALGIFLGPESLERGSLHGTLDPVPGCVETEEAGYPGEGDHRLLDHILVADDMQPGTGLLGPAVHVRGPRVVDLEDQKVVVRRPAGGNVHDSDRLVEADTQMVRQRDADI